MDFYLGLLCATLLTLANTRTTTISTPTIYPWESSFENCGFNLSATCDDKMKLFADGVLLAQSIDWKHTSVVYIPPNTGEIKISCIDGWILGGILASSDNGLMTNDAWKCRTDDKSSTWSKAHELGVNGVTSEDISPEAMWIWTDKPSWKHTKQKRHTTAICTIQLPKSSECGPSCTDLFNGTTPTPTPTPTATPTPTPVSGFSLNATCNNKMNLFADGNLLATSDNWRNTSQVHIPENTQTIEIHCSDSCWLIEGILASSDEGLITDDSWKCSSDDGITWSSAHEIVNNGLSVPDISPNAKWISTGRNTWTDGGKVICMVDLSTTTTTSTAIQLVSTTPMSTGCEYTDKYVECPDFKDECKTGKFIECMNMDCAKTCKCGPIFGDWSPWSSWSECSATCGIAVKTRKRTCLENPCRPAVKEEAVSCHLPSCGPYIQQKCFLENSNITFLDLGHNHMNQDHQPIWNIADNGRRLTETVNTRPSIGLSNLGNVTEPVSFSGRVFSTSGDDDVIGMVFGFWDEANFFVIASARQRPGPTNWYVGRLHATCRLSCAANTTISDAIWDPKSHPEDITVLATGSTTWQHGKEYNFTVCFNPSELLLSVSVTNENQVEPILESGIISAKTNDSDVDALSRNGGFVGVYVDSQAHTTWDYLFCHDCLLIEPDTVKSSGFSRCVGAWCIQDGTSEQYTRCEETRDGGNTCVNPQIKYGSTEGGIPHNHGANDYNAWCKQIFKEEMTGSVTLGPRDCSKPKGKLFWCSGYDEPNPKWCDWSDGKWKDSTLDYNYRCTSTITSLTCRREGCTNGISTTTMTIEGRNVEVRCEDGDNKSEAWTVIQHRGQYGNEEDHFYRNFSQYEDGFGDVEDELWIGLENLAALTNDGDWELQVDLTDWDDKAYNAKYSKFSVGPAPTYQLRIEGFDDENSTLGDSLSLAYHNGRNFTTYDVDNDLWSGNCAKSFTGAWWYNGCHYSHLNGKNFAQQRSDAKGISWPHGGDRGYSRKTWKASVMKIRKINGQQRKRITSLSRRGSPASNLPNLPVPGDQEALNIQNRSEQTGQEASNIENLTEQVNRNFPNIADLKTFKTPSLTEQADQEVSNIPKQDFNIASNVAKLPDQTEVKLEFQLKGKTGMEKVKVSVDDIEEEFDLTTEWRLFSYPLPSSGSFSVEFLNDIGYTDVFIRGHESQVTDLLPNFPANTFLGCGTVKEDEKCEILRQGTLMWNGKYTYDLKGQGTLWTTKKITN